MQKVRELAKRFKEPSSWAGIAGLAATFGYNLDPGLVQAITYALAGVAGLVAILLPEGE